MHLFLDSQEGIWIQMQCSSTTSRWQPYLSPCWAQLFASAAQKGGASKNAKQRALTGFSYFHPSASSSPLRSFSVWLRPLTESGNTNNRVEICVPRAPNPPLHLIQCRTKTGCWGRNMFHRLDSTVQAAVETIGYTRHKWLYQEQTSDTQHE